MKTTEYLKSIARGALLCAAIWSALGFLFGYVEAHAATVAIANDSTDHDMRVVLYPHDKDVGNVKGPGVEVYASPHARVIVNLPNGRYYMLFQYAIAASESWVTNGTIGADPHVALTADSVVVYTWSGGSPGQSLSTLEGPNGSSAGASSDGVSDAMVMGPLVAGFGMMVLPLLVVVLKRAVNRGTALT